MDILTRLSPIIWLPHIYIYYLISWKLTPELGSRPRSSPKYSAGTKLEIFRYSLIMYIYRYIDIYIYIYIYDICIQPCSMS